MKERIIDLGTGEGGNYLLALSPDVDYYCVDRETEGLRIVKGRHSSIYAVEATGEAIPFREETFDKMVILFPSGTLLAPGLQSHIPYPPESNHEPIEVQGANWYEEFARILKPQGELLVYGDWMLLIDEIISEERYKPYFNLKNKQELSVADIAVLRTSASQQVLRRRVNDLETPAYRLAFQKRKIG